MDFVFGRPKDLAGNTGIVVFVDRLSEMAHLAAVPDTIDGEGTATLFIDRVFRQHVCQWQLPLIGTSVSRVNSRNRFSECMAPDWTCPPRTIRRPMVKLNVSIASLKTFYAVCVLRHRSGAPIGEICVRTRCPCF